MKCQKISGVVTDDKGEPVIGANVIVKGTTNGTITDLDGNFSLEAPDGSTLTISYIGYLNKEVRVDGQSQYDIRLLEDTQTLDEVVVVGFGTQKKVNLTGAVSTVKMDEVMGDRPVVSASQALQGAMPGLTITTDAGSPGKSMAASNRDQAAPSRAEPTAGVWSSGIISGAAYCRPVWRTPYPDPHRV